MSAPDKKHYTADDIFRALHATGEAVGLATVYRILSQFEQAGIVLKHAFTDKFAVYELRGIASAHDHMIDPTTGDIVEFYSSQVNDLLTDIAARHGYALELFSITVKIGKIQH